MSESTLKKGMSEQTPIKEKELRGVTKEGQRPVMKKSKVSTDRGKFKIA